MVTTSRDTIIGLRWESRGTISMIFQSIIQRERLRPKSAMSANTVMRGSKTFQLTISGRLKQAPGFARLPSFRTD